MKLSYGKYAFDVIHDEPLPGEHARLTLVLTDKALFTMSTNTTDYGMIRLLLQTAEARLRGAECIDLDAGASTG